MNKEDVKWAHIELSSKCNAWCPACPRNKGGFGLADDLVEEDLHIDKLESLLKQLPNLYAVQLCGNYGDPIVSSNIIEAIEVIKKYAKKIQIHTNGSIRATKWWGEFAHLLSDIDHDIWFGIDGLEDTHSIYRQGTDFNKIIENASAFISNGGIATWQFIPYAHNEHQVKDCLKLSQKLNFKKFKLVKLYRNQSLARHYRSGAEFELLPPKEFQSIIRMPNKFTNVKIDNCMHLSQPSIYLAANGRLSTCCYFSQEKTFDSVDELLYNTTDLAHKLCINNCGTNNE